MEWAVRTEMVVQIRDKRKLISSNLCILALETGKVQQRAGASFRWIFYIYSTQQRLYIFNHKYL